MNNTNNLSILLPTNVGKTFLYSYTKKLKIGTIVKVSFSNRELMGVVWNPPDTNIILQKHQIKSILSDISSEEQIYLPLDLIEFINWVSEYYMMPLGLVLKAALKAKFIEKKMNYNFTYKSNRSLVKKITPQKSKVINVLKIS